MDVEEKPPLPENDFENQVINTEALPQLEGLEFEMHPRRYRKFRLMWFFIVAFLFSLLWITLSIAASFEQSEEQQAMFVVATIFFSLWALVFGLIFLEEIKGFPRRGYVLRERDFSYRSGFLFHSVTTIPFNRIQHSEISQGPIARKFRLSTLKIYTAGGSGSDLKIAGLDPEEAARLREFINQESGKYA